MKLDSAIVMNLVLLFLLSTLGGTLWFVLPTRDNIEQARLAQAASTPPPTDTTAGGKQAVVDPASRWRVQLAIADRDLQSLRRQKAQIDNELRASDKGSQPTGIPPDPPLDPNDARQLTAVLARRRAELETLQLAADAAPLGDASMPVGGRLASRGKEPVWMQLYSGRILPVDEHYYSVRTIDAAGSAFRVLRRTSIGETLDQAAASGSKLQRAMGEIVPSKQYIRCLVAEDSFPLLRGVITLAAERGIELVWDPYKDEDGRIVLTPHQSAGSAPPI